jgi:hypothetical protein
VEDHRQGWRLRHRVSDAPPGAPLTVIFARRQDARREEDGPVRYAGAVTGSVRACATGLRVRAS